MGALLPVASTFAASAAGGLFSAIWEGAALAVCVVLCLRLFPGLSAAARSLVWMNVFMLLVLLHLVPFVGVHQGVASTGHATPLQLSFVWSLVIAGLWTLLSLWRATQLITSAIRLRALVNRAMPVSADAALQ